MAILFPNCTPEMGAPGRTQGELSDNKTLHGVPNRSYNVSACKAVYTGSIPVVASGRRFESRRRATRASQVALDGADVIIRLA